MNLDLARRRTAVAAAALLACAALVAGGCGEKQGGSKGAATSATATATETSARSTTATTPREPDPDDLFAVALSTLLTPDDAPDGWSSAGTAGPLSEPLLFRCLPPSKGVSVTSPSFGERDGAALVQSVQLFPDARSAKELVAAMTSPSGRDCFAAQFADGMGPPSKNLPLEEQVTWGEPELGAFAPLPIGDEGAGARACLTGKTALGARERACTELSMYRVGAAVTTVIVTGPSDDIPRQPVDALATTAVERLAGTDAATSPEAPPTDGDASERARSVVPRLTDLPTGWSGTDRGTVRTDEPFALAADCRLPAEPAEAVLWSPDLTDSTGRRSLSTTVVITRGERAARALFAALGSADVRDCIARDFHEQMRTQEHDPEDVGELRTSVFAPPAVGVEAAGQRMTIEVIAYGQPVTQITDGIVLRSGRAVAIVWQRTEHSPSKQPLTRALLATIAERLRAAGR